MQAKAKQDLNICIYFLYYSEYKTPSSKKFIHKCIHFVFFMGYTLLSGS